MINVTGINHSVTSPIFPCYLPLLQYFWNNNAQSDFSTSISYYYSMASTARKKRLKKKWIKKNQLKPFNIFLIRFFFLVLTALWNQDVRISLSYPKQSPVTWKITSSSPLKKSHICQTRKNLSRLLQVSISTNVRNMLKRQNNPHRQQYKGGIFSLLNLLT